jgi:hypothetical protein
MYLQHVVHTRIETLEVEGLNIQKGIDRDSDVVQEWLEYRFIFLLLLHRDVQKDEKKKYLTQIMLHEAPFNRHSANNGMTMVLPLP